MPTIWNINNIAQGNNKKLTTKLTFETGERFSARLVEVNGDKKEAVLRLLDGWQFSAKLDSEADIDREGILRFEVQGFEDGKLKIKQVKPENKEGTTQEGSIKGILEENGFDKKDIPILEKMLKYNMELTKENISKVKSLFEFKDKVQQDGNEEDIFINRYISSKGIDINSKEGQDIEKQLRGFIEDLKGLTEEDILTLVENKIDLTKENIASFKRLFKEDSVLYKQIEELDKILNSKEEVFKDLLENVDEKPLEKPDGIIRGELESEDIEKALKDISKNLTKSEVKFNDTLVDNLARVLNKFSERNILNNLKQQLSSSIDMDMLFKNILLGDMSQENFEDLYNMLMATRDNIDNYRLEIKDIVKNIFPQDLILTENEINSVATNIEKFTEDTATKDFINNINLLENKLDTSMAMITSASKDSILRQLGIVKTADISSNEVIKLLKNLSEDKDMLKHVIEDVFYGKREEIDKSDLGFIFKNLRNMSSENVVDKLKDYFASKITEGGAPATTIKNLNITTKDINNILSDMLNTKVELKDEEAGKIILSVKALFGEEQVELKDLNKGNLAKALESEVKAKDMDLTILDKMNSKGEYAKNILKEILFNKSQIKPEVYEKVLDFIKNNANDFKMFNSISDSYYYLDMPLSANNYEYPCKLIIKDERNKGKKIDSKDVKMVVTVNTKNLGIIDGFIKVKNQKMDLEIKCDKSWLKLIENNKVKLMAALDNLGFDVYVKFSKKEEDSNITNCRDFFNDTEFSYIDLKV